MTKVEDSQELENVLLDEKNQQKEKYVENVEKVDDDEEEETEVSEQKKISKKTLSYWQRLRTSKICVFLFAYLFYQESLSSSSCEKVIVVSIRSPLSLTFCLLPRH